MAEASESRENGMQAESGGLDPRREGENLARFRELACYPNPFYTGFMPDRAIEIKVNTDVASARDGIAALKQTIEEAAQAAAAMNDTLAATGSALDTGSAGTAYADLADSSRQASDALNELMGKASELETALAELDGSMPDFAEGVAALESLQSSMEIVVEIQQKVAATAEEIDPNLPWEEFGGKMQSVVEVYTEVEATIIRTTEAVVASEESQQAAAEKKAEAVIAAYQKENAQVTQSLGELKAQLEEYKRKMEEAAAAGDKIGQADAIKGIEELTSRIKDLSKAQSGAVNNGQQFGGHLDSMFKMMSSGQMSVRGLVNSVMGMGKAIKAGLGPIGWAVIALEGLATACDWIWGKITGANKAAREKIEKENARIRDDIKKTVETNKKLAADIKVEKESLSRKEIADYWYKRSSDTTEQYRQQERSIARQIKLAKDESTDKMDEINHRYDMNRLRIEQSGAEQSLSQEEIDRQLDDNEVDRRRELLATDKKERETICNELERQAKGAKDTADAQETILKELQSGFEDADIKKRAEQISQLKENEGKLSELNLREGQMGTLLKDMKGMDFDDAEGSAQLEALAKALDFSSSEEAIRQYGGGEKGYDRFMEYARSRYDALTDEINQLKEDNQSYSKSASAGLEDELKSVYGEIGPDGVRTSEQLAKATEERRKAIETQEKATSMAAEAAKVSREAADDAQADVVRAAKEEVQFEEITSSTRSAAEAKRTEDNSRRIREMNAREQFERKMQAMSASEIEREISRRESEKIQAKDANQADRAEALDREIADLKSRLQSMENSTSETPMQSLEARARAEANSAKQMNQIDYTKSSLQDIASNDKPAEEKLAQIRGLVKEISGDKSQITDELLGMVLETQKQLLENAKQGNAMQSSIQQMQASLAQTNRVLQNTNRSMMSNIS